MIKVNLKGCYFTAFWRAADMACLYFKNYKTKRGEDECYEKGDIDCGLHLQCPWRLRKGDEILVGNQDFYHFAEDIDTWNNCEMDQNDYIGRTYFDKAAKKIAEEVLPLKILEFLEEKTGYIHITFERDYSLDVFPTIPSKIFEEEWRFINNLTEEHTVFSEEPWIQVLIVDDKNDWISQMIEYVSFFRKKGKIEMGFNSAGLHPAKRLSERAIEKMGKWYDVRFKVGYHPKYFDDMGEYDFVVPIGVDIEQEQVGDAMILPLYQTYLSTGKEKRKDILRMCRKIYKEIEVQCLSGGRMNIKRK